MKRELILRKNVAHEYNIGKPNRPFAVLTIKRKVFDVSIILLEWRLVSFFSLY